MRMIPFSSSVLLAVDQIYTVISDTCHLSVSGWASISLPSTAGSKADFPIQGMPLKKEHLLNMQLTASELYMIFKLAMSSSVNDTIRKSRSAQRKKVEPRGGADCRGHDLTRVPQGPQKGDCHG